MTRRGAQEGNTSTDSNVRNNDLFFLTFFRWHNLPGTIAFHLISRLVNSEDPLRRELAQWRALGSSSPPNLWALDSHHIRNLIFRGCDRCPMDSALSHDTMRDYRITTGNPINYGNQGLGPRKMRDSFSLWVFNSSTRYNILGTLFHRIGS